MAVDTTSIVCKTFGDILSIAEARIKNAGEVQDRLRNMLKGIINEKYIKIGTERNWSWRKFDRSFVMSQPVTTGTVAVTNGSRAAVFTGLVLDSTYLGRSLRVGTDVELYRIVGISLPSTALLESPYVRDTNLTATHKIYTYEFPLPPDCDVVNQIYIEGALDQGQLEEVNVLEFNRKLAKDSQWVGPPAYYCKDGKIYHELFPPLDVQVLEYDFLAGQPEQQVDKVRIFPPSPDRQRLIHLNYSVEIVPLKESTDEPLMPISDRWMLVHFVVSEWWKINGDLPLAAAERNDGDRMLKEMRSKHQKTDVKPRLIVDARNHKRQHSYNSNRDLIRMSRLLDN